MAEPYNDFLASFGPLALGTRLRRAGVALQTLVDDWYRAQGVEVTAAHMPLLLLLDRKGSATIGELAKGLRLAQPGVTRMVNTLVKDGWVASTTDVGDARVRKLSLTIQGQQFVEEAQKSLWPVVQEVMEQVCGDLEGSFLEAFGGFEEEVLSGRLQGRLADRGMSK